MNALPLIIVALLVLAMVAMATSRTPRTFAAARWFAAIAMVALPATHALGIGWPA